MHLASKFPPFFLSQESYNHRKFLLNRRRPVVWAHTATGFSASLPLSSRKHVDLCHRSTKGMQQMYCIQFSRVSSWDCPAQAILCRQTLADDDRKRVQEAIPGIRGGLFFPRRPSSSREQRQSLCVMYVRTLYTQPGGTSWSHNYAVKIKRPPRSIIYYAFLFIRELTSITARLNTAHFVGFPLNKLWTEK